LLTKSIPELLAEKPKANTDKARQPYRLALALANIPSPSSMEYHRLKAILKLH